MLQATCILKFRDKHNQIYGYRLKDTTGNTRDVKSEALKNAIKNKQIHITNLTLTSDNRLVDTNTSKQKVQPKQTIMSTIEIERSLKFELREIENRYLSKYPKVVTNTVWCSVGISFSVYCTGDEYFSDGLDNTYWKEFEKLNLSNEAIDTMYECYLELWECLSKYHHLLLKKITDKYKDKYPEELLYVARCNAIAKAYGGSYADLDLEYDVSAAKELEPIEKEMIDLIDKEKIWES